MLMELHFKAAWELGTLGFFAMLFLRGPIGLEKANIMGFPHRTRTVATVHSQRHHVVPS